MILSYLKGSIVSQLFTKRIFCACANSVCQASPGRGRGGGGAGDEAWGIQ